MVASLLARADQAAPRQEDESGHETPPRWLEPRVSLRTTIRRNDLVCASPEDWADKERETLAAYFGQLN